MLIAIAFLVGNPLIQASMYGPVGAYVVSAAAVLLSRRSTIAAEVAAEVAETEEGATAADQAEESRAESAATRG